MYEAIFYHSKTKELKCSLHPQLFIALGKCLLPQHVIKLVVVIVRLKLSEPEGGSVAHLVASQPVLQRRLLRAPVVFLVKLVLLFG